jgi:tRNA threonylcarbamoyladenosine biosynthesis protein TsaB
LKIIGIETSSSVFSLCLNDDENVLHEFRKQREFEGHRDAGIFNEAKRLIDTCGGENIKAIAISNGPGMFTSLRVGLSLAKGIALVNNTPVVAVNTLDVIGVEPSRSVSPVAAIINAYRDEIYAAFYEKGELRGDYLLTTPTGFVKMIRCRTLAIGPGSDLLEKVDLDTGKLDIVKDDQYLPSASKVVSLALPRVKEGDFDEIEFLEPYYIKRTDAERRYDKSNAI